VACWYYPVICVEILRATTTQPGQWGSSREPDAPSVAKDGNKLHTPSLRCINYVVYLATCPLEFFAIPVSSIFINISQQLLTSSSSYCHSFFFSFKPCFRRQFLCFMWLVQLVFNFFIVFGLLLSHFAPCNTSFYVHSAHALNI
jgi:hypothetical protein